MWRVLRDKICTVSQVDTRLFDPAFFYDPERPRLGKSYTFAAGQIERIYDFDAHFFGVPPRVAVEMDPQQRLMLQTVWEAVEDAGIDIGTLAGPRTGVFIGSSVVETLPNFYLDPARGSSQIVLGNTLSVIANRISASFDFQGPSQVIDTACASGLSALSAAARAINTGDVDAAIVGAVHIVRTPGGFVGFSQGRMLSPTGLCRAFDAGADGFVRSEACVALVLLGQDRVDALSPRCRARILAIETNSDGRSSPLTVPSAARQAELLTCVLEHSGRHPEDLAFYEAHGTGTEVGDPAEADGLGKTIGTFRRNPLKIGSAKTNFGHAEPAAGLVGLAKVLLAMEHRVLPASLHFETPNPAIPFGDLNLEVAAQATPLADTGAITAGISAFGFGGTNVAAIVESCEKEEGGADRHASRPWLFLSAASEPALASLKSAWNAQLKATDPGKWPALAATAARRSELAHRLALPLDGTVIENLDAAADTAKADARAQTVFAFPGNGAQHEDMGKQAYASNAAFREAFDAAAATFAAEGITDITGLLHADNLGARLGSPLVAQPLLFAWQVATARAAIAAGLRPAAMIGHSLGEITALHMAGVLDLQAAVRVVARRSARFESLRGKGGMVTVAASEADVARLLAGTGDGLSIAAVNSPHSVTVSGPVHLLDRLARTTLRGKRRAMVRLQVEIPYHSAALDPLHAAFLADLEGMETSQQDYPVASSTIGRMLRAGDVSPDFLWCNAREPVLFQKALEALAETGSALIVEIAPKPVLAGPVRDCARSAGLPLSHFAPGEPTPDADQMAVDAWRAGARVDRTQLSGEVSTPRPIPQYPWDEREYFAPMTPDATDAWGEKSRGFMAGRQVDPDLPVWVAEFTPTAPNWVQDHKVGDQLILPATVLIEMTLSAAATIWPETPLDLTGFDLLAPAEVTGAGIRIRTEIDAETGAVRLKVRPRLEAVDWTLIARGTVWPAATGPKGRMSLPTHWTETSGAFYARLAEAGLHYGPAFRLLSDINVKGRARVACRLAQTMVDGSTRLDPFRLDAAFHGLASIADPTDDQPAIPLVPTRIGRLRCGTSGDISMARLHLAKRRPSSASVDIRLFDETGRAIAELEEVEFTALPVPAKRLPCRHWRRSTPLWRSRSEPVRWPRSWANAEPTLLDRGWSRTPVASQDLAALRALKSAGTGTADAALRHILETAPDLADDARAILREREGASRRAPATTVAARAIWTRADELIRTLVASWKRTERLNIAVLGYPDATRVAAWAALDRPDDLVLWHSQERTRSDVAASLSEDLRPRLPEDLPEGAADLIFALGSEAESEDAARIAARDAMILRLDVPIDPVDGPAWYANGPLPVRLRLERATGRTWPACKDGFRALPDTPPLPFPALEGQAGTSTFVIHHGPDALVAATLKELLMRLKHLLQVDGRDRLCLLLWNEGGPHFAALARAAGSMVRTAMNEWPDRPLSLIAVHARPPDTLWPDLARATGEEPILHVSGREVRVERLLPAAEPCLGAANVTLQTPALSTQPDWRPSARHAPKPGEVEVEVAATGLNFRDVLWAQRRLPDRVFDRGAGGPGLGMELSGHVTRRGAGVDLEDGAQVIAFAPRAFTRLAVLPARALVPLPQDIDPLHGAGLLVAFTTAFEALQRTARLAAGETVLIHGASGGVGMAAIQIARSLGARVLATAGSPDKRRIVAALGAEMVCDSRSLAFVEDVLAATDGQGVDVVLNSLSGLAMERSIGCLAPFGRFVEIGKRDYLEGTRVDLSPFQRNLSYFAYDLDQSLANRPATIRETLETLGAGFANGTLRPLPTTVFDAPAIGQAFRHMQSAGHVGKIVVTPPKPGRRRRRRRIEGRWVILGGAGGLGLALARRLREAGAAELHLVSRSGEPLWGPSDEAWAAKDPGVTFHAVDAADHDALGALLDRIGPPTGIVHAAVDLRDRLIVDLDLSEVGQVCRAKLGVAEALDAVLRARDLRPPHVVFLSSLAASLGNPGQSAYAAANAAVEGIAEARRKDGHQATVVALGPIGDRGLLARDAAKRRLIEALDGIDLLDADEAVDEILNAIRLPAGDRLIAALDWPRLASDLPVLSGPCFSRVLSRSELDRANPTDLIAELRDLPWNAALDRVRTILAEIAARILHLSPDQFDMAKPLVNTGLDSLMAMELRLEVERRFGLKVPVHLLTERQTTADLAVRLLRLLLDEST